MHLLRLMRLALFAPLEAADLSSDSASAPAPVSCCLNAC